VNLTSSEKQPKTRMFSATDDRERVTARGFVFVDLITEHVGVYRVPNLGRKAKKRRLGSVEFCSSVYGEFRSHWAEIRVVLHRFAVSSILWKVHLRCGFVGTPVGHWVAYED